MSPSRGGVPRAVVVIVHDVNPVQILPDRGRWVGMRGGGEEVRGVVDGGGEEERRPAGGSGLLLDLHAPLLQQIGEIPHLRRIARILPVEINPVESELPRDFYCGVDEGGA